MREITLDEARRYVWYCLERERANLARLRIGDIELIALEVMIEYNTFERGK